MFNIEDDDDELLKIYSKIAKREDLQENILQYELSNSLFQEIKDVLEMKIFMEKYLMRYSILTKKSQLEDEIWTCHTKESKKYELENEEILFENSLKNVHKYDKVTTQYLIDLLNFFKRHIGKERNINIFYKLIPCQESIMWVTFVLHVKQ